MRWHTTSACLARRYFVQALNLAHASGDRALGGKVLALMSHQANFLGEYQEALDFARAARHGATGAATATTQAMFCAMEARVLASVGDRKACIRSMRDAQAAFARGNLDDDPDWIRYFDSAELHAEVAHCFTALRSPTDAVRHAAVSISGDHDAHPRSRTFCRVSLATSYLQRKEVEQACSTAIEALAIGGRIKSARVREYLQAFDRRLDEFGRARPITAFRDQARHILETAS